MNSSDNITFIGGIHGVGKSSLCHNICSEYEIKYLSASELLKWNEINEDPKNKKVVDIPDTQERLIQGLRKVVKNDEQYLLDGHFSLLDTDLNIIRVPLETFKQINPHLLILILDDTLEIKKRLEARDGKIYDQALLESLQNEEIEYANHLSNTLGVKLITGTKSTYSTIITSLSNHLPKKSKEIMG